MTEKMYTTDLTISRNEDGTHRVRIVSSNADVPVEFTYNLSPFLVVGMEMEDVSSLLNANGHTQRRLSMDLLIRGVLIPSADGTDHSTRILLPGDVQEKK